jgi:hypothetical protein
MKHAVEYLLKRMAENLMLPVQSVPNHDRFCHVTFFSYVPLNRVLMTEQKAREDLKWYLMNKYRALFVDELSRQDLEELQYCHRKQYDSEHGWDQEYLQKFVLKLREYMQDDILKREIAGIETLLMFMKPEDLKKEG